MRFEKFSFGSIRIDGVTHEHDVVIDRGKVRKRKKNPSKTFRDAFGHTPLSVQEKIPWKCRRLVIGTGTGALPVMKEVKREAQRRKIKLLILPPLRLVRAANHQPGRSNPRKKLRDRNRGRECVCMRDSADRFLLPFFWRDISIVLIEVQSHEDSRLGNEQRRF